MTQAAVSDEALPKKPSAVPRQNLRLDKVITQYWAEAVVIALALLLWVPRLSGPIDLRWDGGVYYLLGTSLAQGHGYRIPSEPGSPEAIQYPPLLPAVVALHQWALGTTNPDVVAPWLRKSYAALFVAYAVAVLALGRRFLRPAFAVTAVVLCLLQVMTIFLSDLLFTELPFALVGVLFALVAVNGSPKSGWWLRETASFALASAGFLLRTAGLALLGAWVLEALARRQWRLAAARGLLAVLPVMAWQAHIARVRASDEYLHPAYEYQRAPYQYYNVSYVENIHLIDPFRPELGAVNGRALAGRVLANIPSMLVAVGETASTKKGYWLQLLERAQERLLRRTVVPHKIVFVPILLFTALFLVGLVLLARRGSWLMVFIVLGSLAIPCMTPWPGQFTRYLVGSAPFLIICAVLGLSQIRAALIDSLTPGRVSGAGRIALAGLLAATFATQIIVALKLYRQLWNKDARTLVAGPSHSGSPLFFHDRSWQAWEESAAWIRAHASPNVIVATSAPHFFYLRTGVRAVLPPMDADPERASRSLEAVPVSYVIVDELEFWDVQHRYLGPAVERDPKHWRVVHSIDGTKTYAHVGSAE
jgi:hypothetical protein